MTRQKRQIDNIKFKAFYAKSKVFVVSHYSNRMGKEAIKRSTWNKVHSGKICYAHHSIKQKHSVCTAKGRGCAPTFVVAVDSHIF